MKMKKLFLFTTISVVVLFGLLIASPWGWFWLKGFSATNAPRAFIGIMSENHEVFDGLVNKYIKIGSSMDSLPHANAVWNFGNYSEHWYYMDQDPDNPKNNLTSVKIGCHNGKVILAEAMHKHYDLEWEVVFFESDAKGLKDAWEKKYGNKSG